MGSVRRFFHATEAECYQDCWRSEKQVTQSEVVPVLRTRVFFRSSF